MMRKTTNLDIWAGVVPVVLERKQPMADEVLKEGILLAGLFEVAES